MYHSRLRASNGEITVGVDGFSGELTELVHARTGESFIKSWNTAAHAPFTLELRAEDGRQCLAFAPRYGRIQKTPGAAPRIKIDQRENAASLRIRYPFVESGESLIGISVTVTVELPENTSESVWRLDFENRQKDWRVSAVRFPCVCGVYIGEDWTRNTLVLPYVAGEKIENPTAALATPPMRIGWKWQEYVFDHLIGGPCGVKNDQGAYVRELVYNGPASMMWLDLYSGADGLGLYMALDDKDFLLKAVRAESFGPERPGVGLSFVQYPEPDENVWHGKPCVVAPHPGDWHWGADAYRRLLKGEEISNSPPEPEGFSGFAGLAAHYDFQYQNGGIVHTFKDIPGLCEEALKDGFAHLLLAGWHEDGFDNGFPKYRPAACLGGEAELREAVARAHALGVQILFYVNVRLCNAKYGDCEALIRDAAVMDDGGSLCVESYGDGQMRFATMCSAATAWQDRMADTMAYLKEAVDADGAYLDQLSLAPGKLCCHPGHGAKRAGWNLGYEAMLEKIRAKLAGRPFLLLDEGCCDRLGAALDGQLTAMLGRVDSGAFPEMYRYTFPHQPLLEMMNPASSVMRCPRLGRLSAALLMRAFILGQYLWVYDLEEDNTFRADGEERAFLHKVVSLRRAWLRAYGPGRFLDDRGMAFPAGSLMAGGAEAKLFGLRDGLLIAAANPAGRADLTVRLAGGFPVGSVAVRTLEAPGEERPWSFEREGETVRIQLPPSGLSLAVFRQAEA